MGENKKIAINTIIIFIRLVIVSIAGLLVSRVVLQKLGASDFGLYHVVGGIVLLLNVFNSALTSTTYRYIAYELGKKNKGNPNLVFNTSFAIHAFMAVCILLIGLPVGEWYINGYLNVEPGRLDDAFFVFRISVLTASVSTLLVPYNGLLTAFEKFNVTAIIDISVQLLRLFMVYTLLDIADDSLRAYSLIMMTFTLTGSGSYLFYSIFKYKEIIRPRIVRNLKLYKEMLVFAFWTLFGAVANIGKSQGSNIIVNFFFGTIVNGAFAIAYQVESFTLMFARCLNNAAIPQITKNLSGGNSERSVSLTSYISKYTYFLMLFVAFPVMLDIDFLLDLWLDKVPEGAGLYCNLMILGCLFGCLGEGIPALVNATGKIKNYQLVVNLFLLSGLPISFLLFKFGMPVQALLIVYCIIGALCAFLKLYMLRRLIEFDVVNFMKISYLRMLLVSIPLIFIYMVYDVTGFSFLEHILGLIFMEILLCLSIILLGFDKQERIVILNKIRKKK